MRFVTPDSVRLPMADGVNWIEVKKELSVGEERKFRTAGLRKLSGIIGDQDSTTIDVDWSAMAMARVEAYLVDWSAKRHDGKDQPVTPAAIRALASEDFEEIDRAIIRHIEALAEEKKLTSGATTPLSQSA